MRQIPLTQGQFSMVDDNMYDFLIKWKWHAYYDKSTKSYYARRSGIKSDGILHKKTILMHRVLGNARTGLVIDHINHDTLDNRSDNLRECTQSQNAINRRRKKTNTSGYTGVHWHKNNLRYTSSICINGRQIHLGSFDDIDLANKSYLEASKRLHGEFRIKT